MPLLKLISIQPFAVPALIVFVMALPLVAGVVPMNRVYGIRTRQTLSSDALWYSVNRVGGWLLLLASIVYWLAAALWPYKGLADASFSIWLVHLAAFVLPIILALVVALAIH
jgi:hypothetical protein